MRSTVFATSGISAMTGLFMLVCAGCGDAPIPAELSPVEVTDAAPTGMQTITIHVPEMSDRLKLM